MYSFFEELSTKYRGLFSSLMGGGGASGQLVKTAAETATDLLKNFVTQEGKLAADVAARLEGQPEHGRRSVLGDLIRALTGPDPLPQAWLDAQRDGSFDLFKPRFYPNKGKAADDRELGSPGVYLQRMVAAYRDNVNNRRASPANNAALYTEAAMLTAVIIIRDLQKAVCARAALGVAWVVLKAAQPLSAKIKRQIDALADDQNYLEALGLAIAETTAQHASSDLAERTNDEIEQSLRAATDVDAYFAAHEADQLTAAADKIVAAINERADRSVMPGENGALASAVNRVIDAAARLPLDQAAIEEQAVAATRYLDEQQDLSPEELAAHHDRLRVMMPTLSVPLSTMTRVGVVLQAANTFFLDDDWGVPALTANKTINRLIKAIANRINSHALKRGLPPANTPLEHLAFFEVAVNAIVLTWREWPTRDQWEAAGLLPADAKPIAVADMIGPAIQDGLNGIDVAAVCKRLTR